MSYTNTQSSTILGPLTTTFTPAPSCTAAYAECSTCASVYQAQTCYVSTSYQDAVNCWPPRTAAAFTPAMPLRAWGVYSPGLICPTGYTTACSYDGTKQTGNFEFVFRPHVSEMAIGCCPTGYTCSVLPGEQTCVAAITTAISTERCTNGTSIPAALQPVPFTVTPLNDVPRVIATMTAFAPLFQLNYQATDHLPTSAAAAAKTNPPKTSLAVKQTTEPKPTSTARAAVSAHPTNGSGVAGATTQQGDASTHMSTLQGVGIGIGVTIGIFLLAALIFYIWKMRQRQQKIMKMLDNPPAYGQPPPSIIGGYSGLQRSGSVVSSHHSPQPPQMQQFAPGSYGPASTLEGGKYQYNQPYQQYREVKISEVNDDRRTFASSNYPVSHSQMSPVTVAELPHEPVELGVERVPHNMI